MWSSAKGLFKAIHRDDGGWPFGQKGKLAKTCQMTRNLKKKDREEILGETASEEQEIAISGQAGMANNELMALKVLSYAVGVLPV